MQMPFKYPLKPGWLRVPNPDSGLLSVCKWCHDHQYDVFFQRVMKAWNIQHKKGDALKNSSQCHGDVNPVGMWNAWPPIPAHLLTQTLYDRMLSVYVFIFCLSAQACECLRNVVSINGNEGMCRKCYCQLLHVCTAQTLSAICMWKTVFWYFGFDAGGTWCSTYTVCEDPAEDCRVWWHYTTAEVQSDHYRARQ